MAIRLRLTRLGSKKRPTYRIVAAENTAPRDGKFIEVVGTYSPLLARDDKNRFIVKNDRAEYWMSKGATPSDRVASLFEKAGVIIPAALRPKSLEKSKLNTPKKPGKHAPVAPVVEAAVVAPVVEARTEEVVAVEEVSVVEASESEAATDVGAAENSDGETAA